MAKDRKVTFLIGANIANFQKNIEKANRRIQRFASDVASVGKKLTAAIAVPAAMMAAGAVTSAIDFESAFAGVRKTVDATEVEFAELRQGIRDMSKELPTSAIEIAGVAEAAGQLGIQTDKILGFSKVMVMLGDTTNMAAQDAAMSLARFANIMQLPQDQFDRVGSTIVDLGNNFATTEAEITEFATRIAGAGQIAGLLPADVFAISTALSSVGVQAEAGGTATQKALIQMNTAVATGNKHLQTFAETAGMSARQFQKMWREDAGKAFTEFINGLSRQGDQAVEVLRELGLADQRLVRAFLSLSNAGDLLNRTLDVSRNAWRENTALVEEAEERYKTVQSRINMLRNRVRDVAVTFGETLMPVFEALMEKVEQVIGVFENLEHGARVQIIKIAGLLAAGGPLLIALGTAAKVISGFAALAVSKFGLVVMAVTGVVGAIQWIIDNQRALTITAARWGDKLGKKLGELIPAFGRLRDEMAAIQTDIEEPDLSQPAQFTSFTESVQNAFKGAANWALKITGLDDDLAAFMKLFEEAPAPIEETAEALDRIGSKTLNMGTDYRQHANQAITALEDIGFHVEGTGKKLSDFADYSETAWEKFVRVSKEAGFDFIHFLSTQVSGAISSFAESVGLAMSGTENSFATGLEKILLLVADFAKKLGQMLIAIGTAIMLVPGLQGPSGLYIAGGSALTAIATGVAAGIEKRISNRENRAREMQVDDALIRSDGSVIKFHPDDNILAMKDFTKLGIGAGGRPMRLHLTGELRARGSDLVLALDDARYTLS